MLPGHDGNDAMTCSSGTDDGFIFLRHLVSLSPLWLELDVGLTSLRTPSSCQKSLHGKSPFLLEHVIHGSSQSMGQDRQGFTFTVFVFDFLEVFLAFWITPEKKNGRFRKGPLQMDVADLGARSAVLFSRRALLTLDQP